MQKPKNELMLCLPLIVLALLTACAKEPSSAVSPSLAQYSRPFQTAAANEMKLLPPPCANDVANEHCSAIHRLIIDYGNIRAQIKELKK